MTACNRSSITPNHVVSSTWRISWALRFEEERGVSFVYGEIYGKHSVPFCCLLFGFHFQNTCNIVLLYDIYFFSSLMMWIIIPAFFFFKVHCVSLNWTFGMEKGFFLLIVSWCTAFHPTHSPLSYCITPLATDDQCWQYWIIITCAKCIWFCIKCICIYWGCVQPRSLASKFMTFRKGRHLKQGGWVPIWAKFNKNKHLY